MILKGTLHFFCLLLLLYYCHVFHSHLSPNFTALVKNIFERDFESKGERSFTAPQLPRACFIPSLMWISNGNHFPSALRISRHIPYSANLPVINSLNVLKSETNSWLFLSFSKARQSGYRTLGWRVLFFCVSKMLPCHGWALLKLPSLLSFNLFPPATVKMGSLHWFVAKS